ncbi:MAG: Tfp pilus assembly protein FimT/FimU [Candidatus Krumholzibacteriia bacterium]
MNMNSQRGITLAEMMVTISIIGIMAVVSVPAFVKRNEAQKLQVAANLVSTKVMMARQNAVAKKARYRIEFNYTTRKFRMLREATPGVWELDPPNNMYEIPAGIIISSTSTPADGTIEIEPRGTVNQTDLPVVIRLKDNNNVLKSIRVSRAGMVKESNLWD